jgi:hypothetical protein
MLLPFTARMHVYTPKVIHDKENFGSLNKIRMLDLISCL